MAIVCEQKSFIKGKVIRKHQHHKILNRAIVNFCKNVNRTPQEIKLLSRKSLFNPIVDVVLIWLIIFFVTVIALVTDNAYLRFSSILINVSQFLSLTVIGHDGLHGNLSSSRKSNDMFNDFFVIWPFFATTSVNKCNHLNHHSLHGSLDDPDLYKYSPKKYNLGGILTTIFSASSVITSFSRIIFPIQKNTQRSASARNQSFMRLFPVIFLNAVVIYVFVSNSSITNYFLLWMLPIFAATRLDSLRVFSEHHSFFNKNNEVTRTFKPNLIEKIFLSPKNMSFHSAHHKWPNIPYYNLAKANKILHMIYSENSSDPIIFIWQGSYSDYYLEKINKKINNRIKSFFLT